MRVLGSISEYVRHDLELRAELLMGGANARLPHDVIVMCKTVGRLTSDIRNPERTVVQWEEAIAESLERPNNCAAEYRGLEAASNVELGTHCCVPGNTLGSRQPVEEANDGR